MSDEGTCISLPELKQAAKTHRLTVWQRQWDILDRDSHANLMLINGDLCQIKF